jgi:hypothetical protein
MSNVRFYFMASFFLISMSVKAAAVVWPGAGLSGGGNDYWLSGRSAIGPGGGFDFYLTQSGVNATLQPYSYSVGLGHIWFETSLGLAVDANALSTATPLMDAYIPEFGSLQITINEVFYLGFFVDGHPGSFEETYGWASLAWNGTELVLLDSAAEISGVGIYAGTYTAVPEPISAVLSLIGISVLLIKRKVQHE